MRLRYIAFVALAVPAVAAIAFLLDGSGSRGGTGGVHPVPSFTFWGKLFALLLLAALGVAYLVWRRPVVQAQAILETSPLGRGHQPPPLVDWPLYLRTLVAMELVAALGIWVLRVVYRPLSWTDTLGVLGSCAIVALVAHLLILARGGGGRNQ